MFIDASGEGHYIKNGNQNELRDQDVELIIDTFRNRKTIDKQIEQVARQIEHSNQWKKGLLQKMFV